MQIGLFHQMWAHAQISDAEFYQQALQEVRWADELGYASFWMGEHHLVRDQPFYGRVPIPELWIARLAAETGQIHLGTGVKILTVADPMRFAESMSTLDLLTRGRVVFGIGQGSAGDIKQAGFAGDKRARFRDHLLKLLRHLDPNGEPLLTPRPQRDLSALLWVASRDAGTLSLIAEQGLNLLVGQAEAAIKQQDYIQTFRQLGSRGQVRGFRLVHVAQAETEALAAVEAAGSLYFDLYSNGPYYREAVDEGRIPATPPSDERDLLQRVDYIVGDPGQVATQLNKYLQITGVDQLDVMMQLPLLTSEALYRSMQLFQQEVAPRLQPPAHLRDRDELAPCP